VPCSANVKQWQHAANCWVPCSANVKQWQRAANCWVPYSANVKQWQRAANCWVPCSANVKQWQRAANCSVSCSAHVHNAWRFTSMHSVLLHCVISKYKENWNFSHAVQFYRYEINWTSSEIVSDCLVWPYLCEWNYRTENVLKNKFGIRMLIMNESNDIIPVCLLVLCILSGGVSHN
jgi:hypothetical protein